MWKLKRGKVLILLNILLLLCCFSFCGFSTAQKLISDFNKEPSKTFTIHYIDVGQGDSELVCFPDDEIMLIDTGSNASSDELVNYIRSKSIEKIDYMILTHPHEDHIGGVCSILKNFTVKNVYMPKLPEDMIPSTKTYELTLESLSDHKVNVIQGKAGVVIKKTSDINAQIIGPNSEFYDNLNDYSIVVKLDYNDQAFIFMGDAQSISEKEIYSRFNVKSDVLKCGHHGSYTSTSYEFLKRVNPSYAIISCGKDNKYGHPNKQTLRKLSNINSTVYRTDLNGSIVIEIHDRDNMKLYCN